MSVVDRVEGTTEDADGSSPSPSKGRGVPDGVKWDDGFIGGGWGC